MNIKNIIISTILFANSSNIFGQSDSIHIDNQTLTCEDGTKTARINFDNGIYECLIFGYVLYDDWAFEDYYKEFISDKYGITIKHEGCVITEFVECYDNEMNKLILDKFGDNIYKIARKEAQIAFDKMLDEIDSNEVFTIVDQFPKFNGGNDSLNSYLSRNLNFSDTLEGKAKILLIVEKDGTLSNIKITNGFDKETNKKILAVIKSMPNWIPGKHHDRAVRVKIILPITFMKNN